MWKSINSFLRISSSENKNSVIILHCFGALEHAVLWTQKPYDIGIGVRR